MGVSKTPTMCCSWHLEKKPSSLICNYYYEVKYKEPKRTLLYPYQELLIHVHLETLKVLCSLDMES